MASLIKSVPSSSHELAPCVAAQTVTGGLAARWAAKLRTALCALCIFAALAPTLRDDYLFSDDYYWYDIQHSRPWAAVWEATMMTVMNGRPLHGLWLIAGLPLLAERARWLVLRACGVALSWCLAWALSRALRRLWGEAGAAWVATALAVLPAFALFSYWLVAMPCLVAATLGALALEQAWRPGARAWGLGFALLVLGLSAYQPFALVYFALLGAYVAVGGACRRAFVLGVAAVGSYYVLARACIASFGFEIAKRGELVFEPAQKLRWLLGSALPFASKLWWIDMPVGAAGLGLCALIVSGWWSARRARYGAAECARRMAWIAACALMSVLPHLSVRETVTRFRTLLPLSMLIALLALAVLVEWVEWAAPRVRLLPPLALALLAPAAVSCLALVRASELWHFAVVPERALLLQAASELTRPSRTGPQLSPAERARIIHIDDDLSLDVMRSGPDAVVCVPRLSDDEFAAPSSQHDFAVRGIVRLARELTPSAALTSMENLAQREPSQPTAAQRRRPIDLRRVTDAACARASVVTPVWGAPLERTAAGLE